MHNSGNSVLSKGLSPFGTLVVEAKTSSLHTMFFLYFGSTWHGRNVAIFPHPPPAYSPVQCDAPSVRP